MTLTLQRLSAWPHTPTPAGTLVELANPEDPGTYTVLSSFVTGRGDARPKLAYLLRDAAGQIVAAVNGWRVLEDWPSQRLEQLRHARDELRDLHEALRHAAGEQ